MKEKRIQYFEGLRAIMSFMVVLSHFLCVYYPVVRYADYEAVYGASLKIFAETPLFILLNGDIALPFFFAATGFMVGRSIFRKDPGTVSADTVYRKLVARYLRFLPVIALTTIFTYLTMILGLQQHLKITNPGANLKQLALYCNFTPKLPSLIHNIFLKPFVDSSDYVGPFWTIRYELWNYVVAMLAALVLGRSPWRRLWYVVTILLISDQLPIYYAMGIMGLFLADLQYNCRQTVLSKYYESLLCKKWLHVICLVLSLYLSAVPNDADSVFYAFWYKLPLMSDDMLRGIGISLFLFALLRMPALQKLLSWKPLVALGSISFEVYAIHWPVMMVMEAGLFRIFERSMSYHGAAFSAFFLTLPVAYGVAYLMSAGIKKAQACLRSCRENKSCPSAQA